MQKRLESAATPFVDLQFNTNRLRTKDEWTPNLPDLNGTPGYTIFEGNVGGLSQA